MRVITGFLAALVLVVVASFAPALAQGVPISGLPNGTPAATSLVPCVVAGVTSKCTVQQILTTSGVTLQNLPLNQFAPGAFTNGQCIVATSTTAIAGATCSTLFSGSYVTLSPGSQQTGFANLSGASILGALTTNTLTLGSGGPLVSAGTGSPPSTCNIGDLFLNNADTFAPLNCYQPNVWAPVGFPSSLANVPANFFAGVFIDGDSVGLGGKASLCSTSTWGTVSTVANGTCWNDMLAMEYANGVEVNMSTSGECAQQALNGCGSGNALINSYIAHLAGNIHANWLYVYNIGGNDAIQDLTTTAAALRSVIKTIGQYLVANGVPLSHIKFNSLPMNQGNPSAFASRALAFSAAIAQGVADVPGVSYDPVMEYEANCNTPMWQLPTLPTIASPVSLGASTITLSSAQYLTPDEVVTLNLGGGDAENVVIQSIASNVLTLVYPTIHAHSTTEPVQILLGFNSCVAIVDGLHSSNAGNRAILAAVIDGSPQYAIAAIEAANAAGTTTNNLGWLMDTTLWQRSVNLGDLTVGAVPGLNPGSVSIFGVPVAGVAISTAPGAGLALGGNATAYGSYAAYQTLLAVPTAPVLSQSAAGSLSATTYFTETTYLTSDNRETLPSPESSKAVSANNVLGVASPAAQTNAVSYNVYVATTAGTETKQNASPIALGTAWTEPTSGLIAGTALPSSNLTGFGYSCPSNSNYIGLTVDTASYAGFVRCISASSTNGFTDFATGTKIHQLTASGNDTVAGSILAGGFTGGPTLSVGDGGFFRSTTTGKIVLGGSSSSCGVDYGITTGGTLTFGCPISASSVTGAATLTFGTHLTTGGSSYNGSTGVTITSDATSANTDSTIVARDASGNFSAGTITAATQFTGSGAGLSAGTVPNAALVTAPVTSVAGGTNLTCTGTTALTCTPSLTPALTSATIGGITIGATTATIAAPAASNLALNATGSTSVVVANFNNSSNGGFRVYDGGASNYSALKYNSLAFAGTGCVLDWAITTASTFTDPCATNFTGITTIGGKRLTFASCTDTTVGVITCSATVAYTSSTTYACGMSYVGPTTTTGTATGMTTLNASATSVTGTIVGLSLATGTATILFNCLGS